jgi:hypothetical protein
MPSARRPCRNRTKVGKAVDFFGVAVNSWRRIEQLRQIGSVNV